MNVIEKLRSFLSRKEPPHEYADAPSCLTWTAEHSLKINGNSFWLVEELKLIIAEYEGQPNRKVYFEAKWAEPDRIYSAPISSLGEQA